MLRCVRFQKHLKNMLAFYYNVHEWYSINFDGDGKSNKEIVH